MVYIGCTQKLAKEFKEQFTIDDPQIQPGIHGWHANIFRFYRRKTVMLVNDETRFAVLFFGLRKPDFQNFRPLFQKRLKEELLREGIPSANVAQTILALGPITYGKTHSRSVLGSINDMGFCLETQVRHRLGRFPENDMEVGWLNSSLNNMPCNFRKDHSYFFPKELMSKMLAGELPPSNQ